MVDFDYSELEGFLDVLDGIPSKLQSELKLLLHALVAKAIDLIEDEIRSEGHIVTSQLLASFEELSFDVGALTAEVGSELLYAKFVNTGHYTTDGSPSRWVPGYWSGDRFTYDPSSKTGMLLHYKWIEGSHYFDHAVEKMQEKFPEYVEEQIGKWIEVVLSKFV